MRLYSIYIAGYYVLQAQKINQISFVLFDIMDVYCGAGRDTHKYTMVNRKPEHWTSRSESRLRPHIRD